MHNAVFFDKDGTLIKDIPYNVDPSKIWLDPFASQALTRLQKKRIPAFYNFKSIGRGQGAFQHSGIRAGI